MLYTQMWHMYQLRFSIPLPHILIPQLTLIFCYQVQEAWYQATQVQYQEI